MASNTPGTHPENFRHRITNIRLDPSTADHDVTLKVLVDGDEVHRLALIKRGALLSWNEVLPCDVVSSSRVEIRMYNKRTFTAKRVGTLEYSVSTMAGQTETRLEFVPNQFTAVLTFPTPDDAKKAPATALSKAQETMTRTRPLEKLGGTRDAFEMIIKFGQAVSHLHPAAQVAFGICTEAWKVLEKQEDCDANVERLVIGLADLLPAAERVGNAATSPQLKNVAKLMMDLIEDASRFVIKYRSDGGFVQGLRAVIGSKAQDQVQDLLDKFRNLKENFDRGVGVQTFETAETAHRALISHVQNEALKELKPVGSARFDDTRACHAGTRADIIGDILDWSQRRDTSDGLLWVHGHAGLGKSSIATSVCEKLHDKKLLAAEFFCKRDDSERRNPQRVLTTIIYGLAFIHAELAHYIAAAIIQDPRLCSPPLPIQYNNLIEKPLQTPFEKPPSANFVVIVDALDECGDKDSRKQLLTYLLRMSKLVSWLKIIVTSRPDTDIKLFFDGHAISGISRKNLYDYDASNDIGSFIRHYLLSNDMLKLLPLDATRLLTERANGLFIWAKTACELIRGGFNPKSRFDLVMGKTSSNQVTGPLDALYTTAIETSLGDSGADDEQYVREYLGAIIVCSTRAPLSISSLSDLLGERIETSVLQSLVNRLGSVLYMDHAHGGVVRVCHHSFADYMTASAPPKFRLDVERQNTDFARCCLGVMLQRLRFNICGLKDSHKLNSQVSDLSTRVKTSVSEHLRYSCLYWTNHLTQSKRGELEGLLRKLVLQPAVLYWIEVLSLLGKLDVAMYSALEISKWCEGSDEVYKCARDAYRFIMAFYDPISESTPHLYVSALAFCPTDTAFSQRLRPIFSNTLVITKGGEENWSPWLRCISHPESVFAIAISKDGHRIVSGSEDRSVRVWDADTGAALGSPLEGHSGSVWSVGFSLDSRRIVSGSSDSTVRVWDADTGAALGSPLAGHSGYVLSVGFSPDGRRIVSGSQDKTVRVWDADTGAALGSPLQGHSDWVRSVGFSPDGRRIVSGSQDKTVRVWDADTGAALGSPLKGHSGYVFSVGFSPDGRRIVSGSLDSTVRVWDADTGAALGSPLEGHSDTVWSVGFSPDGRRIVSGSDDNTVQVWDADTGAALGSPLEGHSGAVLSVGFSPDGRRVVSGSDDNTVRVWDADPVTAPGTPPFGPSDSVSSVGSTPDGCHIVLGLGDETVQIQNAEAGVNGVVGSLLASHSDNVYSVGFSPDGRRMVSGSFDNTARVWDADTGAALGSPLQGHSGPVYSVGFSPDGRCIVSGSSDSTVRVWDADTGAALGSPLEGHSGHVYSVGFSPDSRRIVSGSSDSTVRVWDADTGAALGSPLKGHSKWVRSVGFSPDSRRIVSGSSDSTVRVWDADTGAALGSPLEGHSGAVNSVGFSPDGRCIVSGSGDGTVRVWDADTGTALGSPLEGHSDTVNSVGFSPDSRRIVSGLPDNTVRVWDSARVFSVGPFNTRSISHRLLAAGWVRDTTTGDLLIWIPEQYRQSEVDDSLFAIPKRSVPRLISFDYSKFVRGLDWELIFTP